MRTGTSIIGKPVVEFATGQRHYKVQDIIFDHVQNQVLGLLVDEGGWFGTAKAIPLERVKAIGEDAVVIETLDVVQPASEFPNMAAVMQGESVLKGTRLLTESGTALGTLTDVAFDELTGRVEGYEVSGGVFSDMAHGRGLVPATAHLRLGEDVAFVPDEVVEILNQQAGGLKGVAQAASEKVQGAAGKAQAAAGEAKDSATSALQSEKAADYKDKATSLVDKARDAVQETAERAKQDVHELVGAVKEKATEYKDKATLEVEEARIKKAVGRPTNRVIMDKGNQVILDTGDIITYETIEKARVAGVLDVLLSSVYIREPELSTEDLKAKPAKAGVAS